MKNLIMILACLVTSSALAWAAPQADEHSEKVDSIRAVLATAVEVYHDAIEEANNALQSALEKSVAKIGKHLGIDTRVARKRALEQQVASFKAEGTTPRDSALRRAAKRFRKSVQDAARRCFEAHTRAAEAFGKLGDLDAADSILTARRNLLASGNWMPPVPRFVAVNIQALRAHRPRYVKLIDRELNQVVRAGRGKNRSKFRQAVDEAMRATRATKKQGEPRGCGNSREDILQVLEALRAGEWDLRRLRIHERDHRTKRVLEGLPGVGYSDAKKRAQRG